MILPRFRKASIIFCVCLGAAHASVSAQDQSADTTSPEFLSNCRSRFEQVDAAISKAGASFAGYQRIKGFPYLRSDRMLASFGGRVRSFESFDAWTYELRENDGFARNVELSNMGMPDVERSGLLTDLRLCAVWLSNVELADEDTLKRLFLESQLPARIAPPGPATMRALDRAVAAQQSAIKADFAQSGSPATTAPIQWRAKHTVHSEEPDAPPDPLGRIGYTPTGWQEMAEKFAPTLSIETAGSFDSPGAPAWTADGRATIDQSRRVVYYLPSYALVQGQTLVQIIYFIWFSERVSHAKLDPWAGKIDGLMWRVTLDPSGKPILFDSMHMSGFDQAWYGPKSVVPKKGAGVDEDRVLIAQVVKPGPSMVVKLHSGSHNPWNVVVAPDPQPGESQQYELAPYDDLMTLPVAGDKTRSFFDARGIVPGSERHSDIPTAGIQNAGAIRQWGNQPTAFTGRHFYDDPRLIDQLFLLPFPAQQPKELPTGAEQQARAWLEP